MKNNYLYFGYFKHPTYLILFFNPLNRFVIIDVAILITLEIIIDIAVRTLTTPRANFECGVPTNILPIFTKNIINNEQNNKYIMLGIIICFVLPYDNRAYTNENIGNKQYP